MDVRFFNRTTHIFDAELDDKGRLHGLGAVHNEELLPIPLKKEFSMEACRKWMDARKIPEDRIGLAAARRSFGSVVDRRHYMLSLSDQYWVQYRETETWEKLNFFHNRYNEDFGRVFFRPWTVNPDDLTSETPDHTTNGVLKKRWIQDSKTLKSSLIKMGHPAAHQDAMNEVLSGMTLSILGIIPFVRYDLVIDGLQYCSCCENFVTDDMEFVPASHVFLMEARDKTAEDRKTHLLRMIHTYAPLIETPEEYIDDLILSDYCTLNNDRHLGNFGFLRSAVDGKIRSFAPVFDSGSSFFGNGNRGNSASDIFTEEQIEESVSRAVKKHADRILQVMDPANLIDLLEEYPIYGEDLKKKVAQMIGERYNRIRNKAEKALSEKRLKGGE